MSNAVINISPESGIDQLKEKEWLYTNGLGGYSSASVSGMNTRRYHGLLVASFNPPTQRKVLVSKVEETLFIEHQAYELSTNQYPGVIHPEGYKHQKLFERKPFPTYSFNVDDVVIEKTVFMTQGSNTTIVTYKNNSQKTVTLRLEPLYVDRDYHGLFFENPTFDFYYEQKKTVQKIYTHYGATPFYFKWSEGEFVENRRWNKNVEYWIEQYRGMEFSEDTYGIGYVQAELQPQGSVSLTFTVDKKMTGEDPEVLKQKELKYQKGLVTKKVKDEFVQDLILSGDQFIVQRRSTASHSIMAGYHWFTDWSRDTMISMLGLCIATGQKKTARSILKTFLSYVDQGMLPNRFPDYAGEEPEYNTVDGTLWLFIALYEYHQKFNDNKLIREVYPLLKDIIENHIKGTRYNIHVLDNGLLHAGNDTTQLTWMDARIGDFVVTPRNGCPVEVNALWYNVLMIYSAFSTELGKNSEEIEALAGKVKQSFLSTFLNADGYLSDVYSEEKGAGDEVRPNQLYAISLPFSLLTKKEGKRVLAMVGQELLTCLGLRSLSENDPDFRPAYEGNAWSRDTAYHQGTVWAFLLGEYYLAYLKVNGHSAKAKKTIEQHIAGLKEHFYTDACILGFSEIFDGKDPQHGKGCAHQAWSVAQLLRIIFNANLFGVGDA